MATRLRIVVGIVSAGALVSSAVVGSGGAAAAGATGIPSAAYRANDYADGQAMSILPPGENGLVNPAQALQFETAGTRPPNSQDQLGKYENLLYGYPSLTNSSLPKYYDDESFGVRPADITRTEKPATNVVIYRDTHDVPHVYAANDQALAVGAGYAQAEDRLFLMDVLRHYGEGTLSSFLGGSCDFEQMDHDQLLLSPYTQAQATAQVDALPKEYGAQGQLAKSMIYGYVQGVNDYVDATRTDVSKLPADYAAAAPTLVPQKWTVADVVAIAGLIGGIFGKGGGTEVANAHLLQYLQKTLGAGAGASAFAQFRTSNDPLAPTTSAKRFPYETPGKINAATTALPDYKAPTTGGPTDTSPDCNLTSPNALAQSIITGLNQLPKHMSNALVVNANHSAGGHPTAVFGPQVSYFAPQILSELDLHSPDYAAEGASFPGTGIVELGRGEDYAWSATSAGSDLIDQRVEKVCNPSGGAPAANGAYYQYNGKCLPMTVEHFNETALPKPGGLGGPAQLNHTIYLTRHGIVQGWTTVKGKPVAIVNQRSTYNHDVDSVVGFVRWGEPKLTHDVSSWMTGATQIGFTFNWFYVDNRDTGYYVSGRDPVRPSNVNPNLPAWGTGNAEWQGYLSSAKHVHDTNPKAGFFVSWNNKPAPGFAAADDQYGYGQVYRSVLLVAQLKAQLAAHHGTVTRAQVVQAMETAASQDLDGVTVLPLLLKYVSGRKEPAGVTTMLSLLKTWVASGSHRHKAGAGGHPVPAGGGRRDLGRADAEPHSRAVRPVAGGGRSRIGGIDGRCGDGGIQRAADAVGQHPQQRRRAPRQRLRRRVRGLPRVDVAAAARPAPGGRLQLGDHQARMRRRAVDLPHGDRQSAGRGLRVAGDGERRVDECRLVDGVYGLGGGQAGHAGLRRDPVPRPGSRRAAGDRLAEPADLPAGGAVPAAPRTLTRAR